MLLEAGLRETQMANGMAVEISKAATETPEGIPVERVRDSVRNWREHLTRALTKVTALEELAIGKQPPRSGA